MSRTAIIVWLAFGLAAALALTAGTVAVVTGGSSRSLDDLQPDFRAKLVAALDEAKAAGHELYVYETLRSVAQEQADIDAGLSHEVDPRKSYHTPQAPDGKAAAADTWVKGVPFQGKTKEETAAINAKVTTVAYAVLPIFQRHGLTHIDTPRFKDLLHWQRIEGSGYGP